MRNAIGFILGCAPTSETVSAMGDGVTTWWWGYAEDASFMAC